MNSKSQSRNRRSLKARAKIKELEVNRLCVHRTSQHIYAQVIAPNGESVLASASTLDKTLRSDIKHGANVAAAKKVGQAIGERALKAGIKKVAFDRSGFQYHGRIKALAEAAREAGLDF